MDENGFRITVGWRYVVHSQGDGDQGLIATGCFLGYTAIGQDTAMIIESDQSPEGGPGRVYFIPVNAINYLELLERGVSQPEKEQDTIYFG